jgi:hypothetical protein
MTPLPKSCDVTTRGNPMLLQEVILKVAMLLQEVILCYYKWSGIGLFVLMVVSVNKSLI